MNLNIVNSTRRGFLRRCGLLATAAAGSRVVADTPGQQFSPDAEPDWLQEWNRLPRQPVQHANDQIVSACLAAAQGGRSLSLYYQGGTSPGRLRQFSPDLVFQVPIHDHRYVSGYCHLRQAPRILRADRIALA